MAQVQYTFTITVEYDDDKADEDCIGNALDTLLETAMSDPGILDAIGNPIVGQTGGQLQHLLTKPDADDAHWILGEIYKLFGLVAPDFVD